MLEFKQLGPEYNRVHRAEIGPHEFLLHLSSFNDLGPLEYRVRMTLDVGTPKPLEHSFYIPHPHSWEEPIPFDLIEARVQEVLRGIIFNLRRMLLSPDKRSTKPTFWERL